jgi:tetratricopeptide (TPR) repeat protein/calcineurin-like phosphoesterase family protein
MAKRLRILHLSDLHVGKESAADHWRFERVMGDAWIANLREIAADGPIDLVCFTGDLAQKGKAHEYDEVRRFIDDVLKRVSCPRDRFFCVPGNHDVDRSVEPDAWKALRELQWHDPRGLSRWMADGKAPFRCDEGWRDAIVRRQQAYRDFLVAAGLPHLLPQHGPHGRLGYRCTLDLGLGAPLHVIGFDSAWLAGDDNDASKLRLDEDQIGRLLTDNGKRLTGWRIGLVHHPLTDLANARDAQRLLGEFGLDLLLHGHQHDAVVEHWNDPQTALTILAAGCLYEHDRYPDGLLVVDVELPEAQPLRPRQVWARCWSHRLSAWIDDNQLYRGANNGRLLLTAPSASFTPTPGEFVGRGDELEALRAALLPDPASGATARPTAICCAIDGMPGVGKTRLAEQFITEHWLRAYPPPADTLAGETVLRIVLPAGADSTELRSADVLLRELADHLRLVGPIEAVRGQLPAALRDGPGGHPRLVLIENVDSVAQAEQVASLVHGLPDCPVLVTARVRQLGGGHWKRVDVKPLRLDDAVALLRNEAAAAGDGACVPTDAQARQLADALGHLPLALHIAASHLGLGKTPDEFLAELRATGLALAPAQPGDHGLQVDHARAILHSSFALSWKAWCAGDGARDGWQQAMVALAHGPTDGVGESLGAAITDLPAAEYGPCIVGAARLSLLELSWSGDGETPTRRVRLHGLVAEFLRNLSQPDAATVYARIGAWFAPRVSDHDEASMGKARHELQAEPGGLLQWLSITQLDEAALSIVAATRYANANGPYGAWLACFKNRLPSAGETPHGLDLAWAITHLTQRLGDPDLALQTAQACVRLAKQLGKETNYAVAHGQIADILQARGDLDEVLRIRREEELPVYTRLGHVRERAMIQGKIADILLTRGELDEALRIQREEILPVFTQLGEVREQAITQSRVADILLARGELDEALRILREEILPVFTRLGEVRERALTQSRVADILLARGELDEALRILREETLPVFTRLGDVHSRAATQGLIAGILRDRGELDEALRIQREEQIPVLTRLGDVRGLLVARANLAMSLAQRGYAEDRPEILTLLKQALTEAERLRLPEAATIRRWIAGIFGDEENPAPET